ncbi:MAG TPA: hypothetical protein VGB54_13340 [Allosphingosinicella sp.]
MTTIPEDWIKSAVAITPGFETAGDPYQGVAGDFDRMGISCGALQWNIGSDSLQPMVRAVGQPVVLRTMPVHGADMWQACTNSVSKGLAIVRGWQSRTKLKAKPAAELRALMGSREMRAQQDKRIQAVAAAAHKQGEKWAQESGDGPQSKRTFCWFFDLVTQNGGLEGLTASKVKAFIAANAPDKADDLICDFLAGVKGNGGHAKDARANAAAWRNKAAGDKLTLLCASYLRSMTSKPEWRHVVINRKATIAMGRGRVNSTDWNLSRHGL